MRKPLALAILLALPALSQATDAPQKRSEKEKQLEAVQVTATLVEEDIRKIPAPVTVVDGAKLHQNDATVIESFRGVPGAFVQQTTPGQSTVFIRGSKGSEVLHLVDGFRLNSGIFRNAPNQYFALVDGQSLDRAEILRGPSAGLYGSDAMGGVVNLLTPDPLTLPTQTVQHELRGRADSAQALRIAHYQGAARGERFAAQVSATSVNAGNREIGGGDERPFSSFESNSVSAKLAYDGDRLGRFALNLQDSYQPLTHRHDELVPGFGQTSASAAVATFEPQQRQFAQLKWEHDFDNAAFQTIKAQLGRQVIRDDRRSRDAGSFSEARERNTDRMTGASVLFSGNWQDVHRYSLGLESYGEKVKASRANLDIRSGVSVGAAPRFPSGSTQGNWSIFAIDDWRISDRLDWVISARFSDFELDVPRQGSIAGVAIDNSAFSGHTGLSFAMTERTRLVGNIGRGFRAPNIFDVGQFGNRPSSRFAIPNPDLDPETVIGVDLGVKHDGDHVDFEVFAFRSEFDDKIVTVLTGRNVGTRREVQNRNASEAELYGLEAGMSWRISTDWSLDASMNWTRGTEVLEGDESAADRIPPLNGFVALNFEPNERWRFDASLLTASRQDRLSARDLTDPRLDPNGTGGWARLDLGAAFALSPDVDLSLRVENLTDKRYREHGSGIDAVGRNVIVGADWRF